VGVLEARGICVKYGAVPAVKDVSISIGEGQVVVILGPNGSGKSTFIKSVMGLVPIEEGEISYRGARIDGLSVYKIARCGIALVPEGRGVFADMSVIENLYLGGYRRNKKEIEADILEMVKLYFPRLMERKKQMAGTLSGGEQQMLAIARALMSGARLILLDEPSLGLSPLMVKEVTGVIRRLNKERGVTMLMVEQNAGLGLNLADYVYLLEGGCVRLKGTSQELLSSDDIVRAYIGTKTLMASGKRPLNL